MNTSNTSTVSIEKQIEVLSVLPNFKDKFEWAEKFTNLWDMSIPLAVCVQLGWVEGLTDKGVEEIERCFLALSDTFEKTPEEMMAMLESGNID